MSRRKEVLENAKTLRNKVMDQTQQLIDELDFNELDELPSDIREAIQEAETAYGEGQSNTQLPSGQPYRLSDADDFPFGTYIQNKTGRIVSKHFRMSDEYFVKQDKGMALIKELGFTEKIGRASCRERVLRLV